MPSGTARVNNAPIYLETFNQYITGFEQAMDANEQVQFNSSSRSANIKVQVLDSLIEEKIIEQQAQQLGLAVTAAELEQGADEAIAAMSDRLVFEYWLAENKLTPEQFADGIRRQLLTQKLYNQVTLDVSDEAEQIHLHYIRVDNDTTARAIVDQLKQGHDFLTLAAEQSLDSPNGDLGRFPEDTSLLPLEVEAIAFNLQPGEVSGPIYTPMGLYIIKLKDREISKPL